MPYKPKFCCECSEPIERVDWTLLTSRRFCQLCETDYKFVDLIPKIALVTGILLSIFGLGTFLHKTEKPLNVSGNFTGNTANTNKNTVKSSTSGDASSQSFARIQETNLAAAPVPVKSPNAAPKQNLKIAKVENQTGAAAETIYFCGAETKKGTLCTRRVKGGGRCWQHKGKPAMLPPDKLVAVR